MLLDDTATVYVGETPVARIYLGEQLVWDGEESELAGYGRTPYGTSPYGG